MRAAIYARISKDREGAGLGVERQIADCTALCERNGWDIAYTLTDNDISAYNGAPRPGYTELLQLIADRQIDVVVVWHADRLHRRNSELERYIDVSGNDVATHTVKAGTLDLATPAGRAIARTLGAWASYEVETAQTRTKAAKEQSAAKGRYGGGSRWYGYALDDDQKWRGPKAIDEHEATILQEARKLYIQGESVSNICRKLRISMHPSNFRRLLLNPHNAGILVYKGTEYPGDWPAIFTQVEYAELLAARESAERMKNWALNPSGSISYLLTGLAVCSLCNGKMQGGGLHGVRRYRCNNQGCNRMFRLADPLETYVTEAVLEALDTPELGKLLDVKQNPDSLNKHMGDVKQNKAKLERLVDAYQDGLITKAQFATRRTAIESAIQAAEKALSRELAQRTTLTINVGERLSDWWQTATLTQRRKLLGLCIVRIECYPTVVSHFRKGDRYKDWLFRPQDVKIIFNEGHEHETEATA